MRFLPLFVAGCILGGSFPLLALQPEESTEASDVETLVGWLLQDDRALARVRFSDVIRATVGKEVIGVDPKVEADARILRTVEGAVRVTLVELNKREHPVHQVKRINEVSGYVEELLVEKLEEVEGLAAGFPRTAAGHSQRSGYPDIRIVDAKSGRVFYLDPKLYAEGSEGSSFRTFYFEPKVETNKVLEDASHLIIGIAHGGKRGGRWHFLRWRLIDLVDFEVRLKAEFQGSNRQLYREEAVVGGGEL